MLPMNFFTRTLVLLGALLAVTEGAHAQAPVTDSGIALDQPWKITVHEFAVQNVKHPSWGLAHSERNYHNTVRLAEAEGVALDTDALFVAAFLHDVGGMPAFRVQGVDHAVRSAEVAEPFLTTAGFPMEKWPLARDMILGHTYYGPSPTEPQVVLFRDADILDFLGAIGIARLTAATGELGRNPTLATPFALAETFITEMPGRLGTGAARADAACRIEEMKRFIGAVRAYTHDGKAF